jgi:hypothetical protein
MLVSAIGYFKNSSISSTSKVSLNEGFGHVDENLTPKHKSFREFLQKVLNKSKKHAGKLSINA